MELTGGSFTFLPSMGIDDQGDFTADNHLRSMFNSAAGFSLSGSDKAIVFKRADTGGEESYRLSVGKGRIVVEATEDAGAFYAVQTIRQLLPDLIEGQRTRTRGWTVPNVKIADEPQFGWRGLMMDESRHFFGVEYTKNLIDWLALHKLNSFHWHLVDDGGWRVEIDKYPKLTEIGAWREDTDGVWPGGNWNFGNIRMLVDEKQGKRYGGFYTKDQIREIVQYSADRHITIVPEIEMPGHCMPALISYPELLCEGVEPHPDTGGSYSNVFCAGKDLTFEFLENVMTEVLELFPSKFIHIGADEVWKGHWEKCSDCAKRMDDEGLADTHELQSWFVRKMDKWLADRDRRLVGWDEILEGGLAEGATVMSWRGVSGGVAAAKQGRDVVMSPTSHCYFDYAYNNISTEKVYAFNPVVDDLETDEEKARVLGGQANVWTEWIPTEERAEYMTFPRLIALAEVLWTREERRSWPDFQQRLLPYFSRLDRLGINYHPVNPDLPETALLMNKSSVIDIAGAADMPWPLHWTSNGADPTKNSRRYTGPIRVTRPGLYKFAFVMKDGTVSDIRTVEVVSYRPRTPKNVKPGLKVSAYTGSWEMLPDFNSLTPEYTVVTDRIGVAFKPQSDNYAMLLKGWLYAPSDGFYRFRLGSDDGSRLTIGGAMVIDHDGPHGHNEKAGAMRLKKGFYPIEVQMFEIGGGDSLSLRWSGPGFQMKPVNPEYLWH